MISVGNNKDPKTTLETSCGKDLFVLMNSGQYTDITGPIPTGGDCVNPFVYESSSSKNDGKWTDLECTYKRPFDSAGV